MRRDRKGRGISDEVISYEELGARDMCYDMRDEIMRCEGLGIRNEG